MNGAVCDLPDYCLMHNAAAECRFGIIMGAIKQVIGALLGKPCWVRLVQGQKSIASQGAASLLQASLNAYAPDKSYWQSGCLTGDTADC